VALAGASASSTRRSASAVGHSREAAMRQSAFSTSLPGIAPASENEENVGMRVKYGF
jgi:hypothetical protein